MERKNGGPYPEPVTPAKPPRTLGCGTVLRATGLVLTLLALAGLGALTAVRYTAKLSALEQRLQSLEVQCQINDQLIEKYVKERMEILFPQVGKSFLVPCSVLKTVFLGTGISIINKDKVLESIKYYLPNYLLKRYYFFLSIILSKWESIYLGRWHLYWNDLQGCICCQPVNSVNPLAPGRFEQSNFQANISDRWLRYI